MSYFVYVMNQGKLIQLFLSHQQVVIDARWVADLRYDFFLFYYALWYAQWVYCENFHVPVCVIL